MDIPWWGWVVGSVVAMVAMLRAALKRNRVRIETEFVYYLQECFPSLSFVRQEGKTMVLRHERAGEIRFYMHRLYVRASRARRDPATRRKLYEQSALTALEAAEPTAVDPVKLRPRLVREGKLLGTDGKPVELPSRRLEGLGLRVVYVLDSPASVRYVTSEMASQLGLDEPALYERALANLAVSAELVRGPLEKPTIVMVKTMDGHDAARLLAVPRHLRQGESLLALIPDVNTLALIAATDPAPLMRLARAADGEPLFDGVVRVTCEGLSRAA